MVQLTDPADTAKAFEEVDFEWVKLGAGRFLVKRVVVDLDGALLAYHFSSSPGRSRSRITTAHYVVVAFSPSATGTLDGREIRPNLLVVGKPGGGAELVAGSNYRAVMFLVPPVELENLFETRDSGPHFIYGELGLVRGLYRPPSLSNLNKRVSVVSGCVVFGRGNVWVTSGF